ncbi:MAG: BrnA antitoxin family protein [Gammaproteobacteria bacterium]|nr:BrnA antitoxin family protein [Gammaproteobacteria bacterium]MYA35440.1 BrnA antitoxin family protein [Gammaproteobacteria bacterium]MYH86564.1 BrnA antitoxin family protein [Gammaproteobacteria bacterium]MYK04776.1 BrnA antitoxin family protein [Gammaproteobacteria bacterium]
MKKYEKPLTTGEIAAVRDKRIDFSDIPELDDAFWHDAELVEPDTTEQVTMRIKRSVLDFFKMPGQKGYQTRINRVLETYVQRQRKLESSGSMNPLDPQR